MMSTLNSFFSVVAAEGDAVIFFAFKRCETVEVKGGRSEDVEIRAS